MGQEESRYVPTVHQAHRESLSVSWDELTRFFRIKNHAGYPHNNDALYTELTGYIAQNHQPYSGDLFSGFADRFMDKDETTFVFMTKDRDIFIYFLDYRHYENHKKSYRDGL